VFFDDHQTSKAVPVHAIKAQREILFSPSVLVESESTSYPILFIPVREPQYPFKKFGGPQAQSG